MLASAIVARLMVQCVISKSLLVATLTNFAVNVVGPALPLV